MLRDLGPNALLYGYPMPVLMLSTYNDDGSVNVMNLHECTRTNAGDLALCPGPGKKSYENIGKRGAFTIALATADTVKEIDFFGIVSGYDDPEKFSKTSLSAVKSEHVDAPIIEGLPLVIECKLIRFIKEGEFSTVLGKIVNVAADESVLDEAGRIDVTKTGMIFYDSFSSSYFSLGEKVGSAFRDGRAFL